MEGMVKLKIVASQVYLELEGECWYACHTLNDAAVDGLYEWLTCYRLARK